MRAKIGALIVSAPGVPVGSEDEIGVFVARIGTDRNANEGSVVMVGTLDGKTFELHLFPGEAHQIGAQLIAAGFAAAGQNPPMIPRSRLGGRA